MVQIALVIKLKILKIIAIVILLQYLLQSTIDDNPIATNVSSTTDEDSLVTFNLSAEEYDGDTYEFIISEPSNGTASIASAQVTYVQMQTLME